MADKKEKWECSKRGCKNKPEELHSFTAYGNNKNKGTEGSFCEDCFNKLWKEGEVEVRKAS